jgi:hypothetical protein
MDPRYLYLADDLILLKFNNRKSKNRFYQAYAGVEIMNRDNISDRLNLRILAEYRDINSKIPFIFFDF